MSEQPVVVIQGAATARQVPGIGIIADEAELRFADSPESLAEALSGAAVLLGWNFSDANLRGVWPHAGDLKWIHWTGAGVDAVLFPELTHSDVVLTNSRGIFDRAMAEYVLGLILAFAKHFPETTRHQDQRRWEHRLSELVTGAKVLIVGVGSIGREIAGLLSGVGLQVQGVGRRARVADADFGEIHGQEDLNALLPEADYVVIVVPLTAESRGMFGAEQFAVMKPTARIINVARGAVVDEGALAEALRAGRIAGAALDVTTVEPLPGDSPLWAMPQVIVSPHMSGDYVGYQEAVVSAFIDNFRRFQMDEPLLNVVDKTSGFVLSDDDQKKRCP
ncbi:MAG: D-2-hydroxyacid dehydrogenase [Gammaproteobacteria bacterium]|nr:D-2-hydroxyacid dehydrogenase [Gammaproteobacteria bacterium]MDX2462631.1 D-2-hydroxyacid dehydrogenase [Gammaproteobacteria bacterium]